MLSDVQIAPHLSSTQADILNAMPLLIFSGLSLLEPAFGRRYGIGKVRGAALLTICVGTVWRPTRLTGTL